MHQGSLYTTLFQALNGGLFFEFIAQVYQGSLYTITLFEVLASTNEDEFFKEQLRVEHSDVCSSPYEGVGTGGHGMVHTVTDYIHFFLNLQRFHYVVHHLFVHAT